MGAATRLAVVRLGVIVVTEGGTWKVVWMLYQAVLTFGEFEFMYSDT